MRFHLALIVLLFSGSAMAVTIDFEQPITQLDLDEGGYPLRLQTQGFEFTTDEAHWATSGTFAAYCFSCSATVNTISGDAFSLSSIDLASVYPNEIPDVITVTGNYVGGGQISTTLNLTSAFATYNLGAGWDNLQSVDLGASLVGNAIAMDNVVVTAVPVPAAVWLFGSALVGLGWLRSRQGT